MPRGIPNAKPVAGAGQYRVLPKWDVFAAAALTGYALRGNKSSEEMASAAANAADRMMAEREKRFPVEPDTGE